LINGQRLGAEGVREQYFLGAELARDLQRMAPGTYRDVYGSYGPRSFRYAEMVFGNTFNAARLGSCERGRINQVCKSLVSGSSELYRQRS
jgi:hypothetical protein